MSGKYFAGLVLVVLLSGSILGIVSVTSSSLPKMTREELAKYDGSNGKSYLAMGGLVFDVSESPNYQKGGGYSMFAGKDATLALGKMSFDPQWLELTEDDVEMSEGLRSSIQGWKEFYEEKYPVVAELVKSQKQEL